LTLAAVSSAFAESVGRVSFTLPSEQWQLVGGYERELKFNEGLNTTPLTTRLYQLPGDGGMPRALLLVTSTDNSTRPLVNWVSESCPPARDKYFADDFGTNRRPHEKECLIVNTAFSAAALFKDNPDVQRLAQERGIRLPATGHSLRSTVGSPKGLYLHVNLMTPRGFKGLPGSTPRAADLQRVDPALVAWAEALHDAVKSSVYSVTGKLELPPIDISQR
jgi:hypothetical protein